MSRTATLSWSTPAAAPGPRWHSSAPSWGLEFTAVFSDAFSHSKKQAMQAFGATVLTEPSHGAGITPELAGRMRDRAYALAEEPGHYYADQGGAVPATITSDAHDPRGR